MNQPVYRILSENIDPLQIRSLASELGIHPLIATLLCQRGVDTKQKAEAFLHPDPMNIHDPMLLPDMDMAVQRIQEAIDRNESVCIYGDYDVDGVTATAILYRYLYGRGVNVKYYIPSREGEGYGLNGDAIRKIADDGVNLIITVDTGTTAVMEVELAKQLGMDVVITDHHSCPDILPKAPVVNPTRVDSPYPFSGLAGVGVSFKLICALEWAKDKERDYIRCGEEMLMEYGDLLTLGTVADVMPLLDENRYFVKKGLEVAGRTRNKGLAALIDAVLEGNENRSAKSRNLTAKMIGFNLAPKINAAGRMESADLAEELFLCESDAQASVIAHKLCELNKVRQSHENEIVLLAVRQIAEADLSDDPVLVLGDEDWHAGVIGIAAARISERYGKPAVLISFDGNEGKGSMRSVDGFDSMQALSYSADLLTKYGGHTFAAGLSILRENFHEFRRRMCEFASLYALEALKEEGKTITADAELQLTDITLPVVKCISDMAPFGCGNEIPLFMLNNVEIESMVPLSNGKHTRLVFAKDDVRVSAVLFGCGPHMCHFQMGDFVDVFGNPEINEYGRNTYVQFMVKKIYLNGTDADAFENQKVLYREVMEGQTYLDDFPDRNAFATVYRFLNSAFQNGISEFSFRHVLCCCKNIGYCRLRVILDIFKHAKLLEYHPDAEQDKFRFGIQPVTEKVCIENTPLYRRLQIHDGI